MLEPNEARLKHWLDVLSSPEVGGTRGGGVSRPALSPEDRAVRDQLSSIVSELGLELRVDDGGNMYARRDADNPRLAPVVIGSHLDTVVPGGRFDGILGVAIALETIALLNDADIRTARPLEVVNWMGEEGARFPPAMLGSGLVTGVWDAEYLHGRQDADGVRVGDALAQIGYLGSADHRLHRFHAALEVHIEQGTQLDATGNDVGIVPTIDPVRWCEVQVTGTGGHAGGPGPSGRKEALVAASRMIVAARDTAVATGRFKTTVGRIDAEPGATNVIPHAVRFALDVRSGSDERLDEVISELTEAFERIAGEEGVEVTVTGSWSMRSTPFDGHLQELLRQLARERGVAWMDTPGRIGHDSLHLAAIGPTAMLFTRTSDGVSHAESEHAPWSAVLATAGVFANATLALANEPGPDHDPRDSADLRSIS